MRKSARHCHYCRLVLMTLVVVMVVLVLVLVLVIVTAKGPGLGPLGLATHLRVQQPW